MKQTNYLKGLRVLLAILFFIPILLYFVDFANLLPESTHYLLHIQLMPAVLGGFIVIVIVQLLLALFLGRIYCSTFCPAGVLQDVINRIFCIGKKKKKGSRRFNYHKPYNWLRYSILAVTAILAVFGISELCLLLDPYSNFGRIATNLFRPVVMGGNNLLADLLMKMDNYAVYHASVPVNVTLTKISEGSYDFEGSTNIDGTTKADDLGLTINVKGNVTTAGKLTVTVTTSGWGSISNVFSGDSLNVTYDGTANNTFPVTLLTTAKGKASLLFSKIPNVANNATAEVTVTESGDSYKLEGTSTLDGGFTVKITGTATKTLLTLAVTTSGYGTLNKSYTASDNTITYDGAALTSGYVSLKATSETSGTISISGVIPGPSNVTSVDIPNCTIKEVSDGSYTVSGSSKTSAYELSFNGTITNKKLNGAITYKILSSIVGTCFKGKTILSSLSAIRMHSPKK